MFDITYCRHPLPAVAMPVPMNCRQTDEDASSEYAYKSFQPEAVPGRTDYGAIMTFFAAPCRMRREPLTAL